MSQDWNSLIRYVKRKLGSPPNKLELSDDEIYEIIKDDVLPELSQFSVARTIYIRISNTDHIDPPNSSEGITFELYKIPVPDDIRLIDVQEVYYNRDNMGTLGVYQNMLAVLDPRDAVMTNEFLDMLNSLEVLQAFEFRAPDEIMFERPLLGASVILECKVEHTDLNTIPSDVYREIFKPWCVAEIMEDLASIRKKYRSVNTPFGEIGMNWEELETKAASIKETIKDKLDAMPPDHLVHII